MKKQLYRSVSDKKVAGVCAGVAEYFGVESWLVRVITVSAFFLLAGPFVLFSYIAGWFILETKPTSVFGSAGLDNTTQAVSTSEPVAQHIEIKKKVWQAGQAPVQAMETVKKKFTDAEDRLQKLEGYVTSKSFHLDREFSKL